MPNAAHPSAPVDLKEHLANVEGNLQLVADLGYGDVSLAVASSGTLLVTAEARPMTAVAAGASRIGSKLRHGDQPEAYESLSSTMIVAGEARRATRGISFTTTAYPVVFEGVVHAVIVRNVAQQVLESPGKMETVFMRAAEEILEVLMERPLLELDSERPFSTVRRAGDGVIRLDEAGEITYASPNAVNIMRLAGVDLLRGSASRLPGGDRAMMPVVKAVGKALHTEVSGGDRQIGFRAIGLSDGGLVLVEDVTEARQREQEIKVKEATIREVHHRVKNNLQTIASLLRIQARRASSEEAQRALSEAMERVSSMAVVHELLEGSTEERIDFTDAAHTVVDMVRRGLAGEGSGPLVSVKGRTGEVPAQVATSLALVLAELVHNAIEHGFTERGDGNVAVEMRRLRKELVLTVRDDGVGLPAGFDIAESPKLGLAIVRTIVEDDLSGTLSFGRGPGSTVTVRFPLPAED